MLQFRVNQSFPRGAAIRHSVTPNATVAGYPGGITATETMTNTKRIELENLAVMFRTLDANIGHVSTFELMKQAGLGHCHGTLMAIPRRHKNKRRALAERIAGYLDKAAKGDMPWNSVPDAEAIECIRCLTGVIEDVLPQIGGIVLQDYERLNRGLLLSAKILKSSTH